MISKPLLHVFARVFVSESNASHTTKRNASQDGLRDGKSDYFCSIVTPSTSRAQQMTCRYYRGINSLWPTILYLFFLVELRNHDFSWSTLRAERKQEKRHSVFSTSLIGPISEQLAIGNHLVKRREVENLRVYHDCTSNSLPHNSTSSDLLSLDVELLVLIE